MVQNYLSAPPDMHQSFDGLKVDVKFLSQLQLSSTWKRPDIARDKLFKGGIGFSKHVCIVRYFYFQVHNSEIEHFGIFFSSFFISFKLSIF